LKGFWGGQNFGEEKRMDQERRDFLRACLLVGAASLTAPFIIQCSNNNDPSLPGGSKGTVTVNLSDYPALAQDNKVAVVHTGFLSDALYITHTTGESYHALNSHCTHQGCTVGATAPTLRCPCHGSQFTLTGSVVNGPAPRGLIAYKVTKADNVLTVDLATEL
jgi:cytochrome b6-f complex iron-sulfur subunit